MAADNSYGSSSTSKKPRRSRQNLPARVNFWGTIVTALTAVAALTLSVVTWSQLNSRPAMLLAMPKLIGWSASEAATFIIIQPTLAVADETEVTAIVSNVDLRLSGPAGQQYDFFWLDNKILEGVEGQIYRVHKWASDPAPLSVTPDDPQAPYLGFQSLDLNMNLITSGTWEATFVVRRLEQDPLVVNFCMELDEAFIGNLTGQYSMGLWWVRREGEFISTQTSARDPHCYKNAESNATFEVEPSARTD